MSGATRTSRWLPCHAFAVFGFLYLPIVTLIVTPSTVRAWEDFLRAI